MKNMLLIAMAALTLAGIASAGTIKPGSVVCMTQKYLDKYEVLEAAGHTEYLGQMKDRVQCVVRKKPISAIISANVGEHIQVEVLEGYKLWLNTRDFEK